MAQTAPAPAAPDLSALFAQAWQRQPEAQALQLRRQAAQAERDSADAWTPEPAALDLQAKTDRIGSRQGARETTVGVVLPLWLPGERARKAALGDAALEAAQSRTQAAQLELAARVREAWWGWQRARSDLAQAQSQRASAQALATDVARRYQAGDMARSEHYQAEAGVAQAQALLAEAQGASDAARLALQALAGAPAPDVPAVAGTEPEPEPSPAPSLALPLPVPEAHPALADWLHQARVARRQAELVAVQGRANPELSLSAARERGTADERYQQSITLGVRLPLGAGVRAQAREAAALAQALELETRAERERERLGADIQAAQARVRAATAQREAMARHAELARATRGFVAKAFALGEADWPMRLRVEQDAAQAERQLARARIEAAAALSALRQALGLLPQ
jgi:cobalt-zinc-cadmium efflux system outer membrane protein